MSTPHEWLKAIGATESLREIAARSGVSHATLSRQISNGRFLIETCIELARAYGVSPISALVANGHLTPEEGGVNDIEVALHASTDEQLVIEVGRRMGIESPATLFDAPVSQAVASASNVVRGDFGVGGSGEDLDAVARPSDPDDGEDQ